MGLYFRLSRTLVILAVVGIGVAQAIGDVQPVAFAAIFTNPDGTRCQRPCLLGVRPGITSSKQGFEILQAHPFTRNFEPDITRGLFTGPGLSVILFTGEDGVVTRIDLIRTDKVLPAPDWAALGDVLAIFGVPDRVGVDEEFTRSYYVAEQVMFIHRHTTQERIRSDERFEDIFVYGRPLPVPANLMEWHGFSTFRRYLTEDLPG